MFCTLNLIFGFWECYALHPKFHIPNLRCYACLSNPLHAQNSTRPHAVHLAVCYTPPEDSSAVSDMPCESVGYITFGSFNNVAKVNASVVRLWARILTATPGSRMLFKSRAFAANQVKESCASAFSMAGIDRSRVSMMMVIATTQGHLDSYSRMDISLDTFPYAGTTTTFEALFMGVPVVTLRSRGEGSTHAHNVGVSILTQVKCLPSHAQRWVVLSDKSELLSLTRTVFGCLF